MKRLSAALPAQLRPIVVAVSLAAAGAAHAVITAPADVSTFADYGNGGNVFQVEPLLFVQGLGSADNPATVVGGNALLQYSSAVSGWGTSLLTLDYRVRNVSPIESFSDLRFMFFANPDGGAAPYLDVLSETWGAAAAGDPVRREGREFVNPADTILSNAMANNNLTEGYTAACLLAAGCDATAGLQWNAALLGPGETFRIRVGLSDDGQHLSPRWIDATSVSSPGDTALRLSGVSSIVPVPEPASAAMLAAGLALLGAVARRRSRL